MSEELAWAAGLFDGEGSIGYAHRLRKTGRYERQLQLSVGQKTPEVLNRFREAVGQGKVYYKPSAETYAYRCTGETARDVFETILPWLSPVKTQQGTSAIKRFDADETPESRAKLAQRHAECDHDNTKTARTLCRRQRDRTGETDRDND